MTVECDILIVGGGMTGVALALALGQLPLKVIVIEARSPDREGANEDDRSLTLSPSSRRLFEAIGMWPTLADCGPMAIREIHISDAGPLSGTVHLNAHDLGVDALGYVFENKALSRALLAALPQSDRLTWFAPASIAGYDDRGSHLVVRANQGEETFEIHCRLMVGSDGTSSRVRELAGIRVRATDYGQTALVARFTPEFPAPMIAFERFTPSGPLAVLPRSGGHCGLVLSVSSQDAGRLNTNAPAVRALAEARFGSRLGRFQELGSPRSFPLRRVMATSVTAPRVALIGNAAHTLHPVAAQGLNLGLRDVAALAEMLEHGCDDPGAPSLLREYAKRRRHDILATSVLTHALVRLFSNRIPGLGLARRAGLALTDALPGIKADLALRTMGLAGRLPPLLREGLM